MPSKAEKLLVAAGNLATQGKRTFAAEDLVVEAWNVYPEDFGLKGYDHPNSNYVLTHLMGKSASLIVRGWLEKTGTNTYRLTDKGLADASPLLETAKPGSALRLGRNREQDIGWLLTSTAYELWCEGKREEITFHHFCRFFGLAAGDKWQKIAGRLEAVEHTAAEAMKAGEAGSQLSIHFRKRNYAFTPEQLREIGALTRYLKSTFAREMREWRRRAGG